MAVLAAAFRALIKTLTTEENMTDETPPWTLIFAGTADIDANNLTALLDNWLPSDLEVNPPVIHAANASTHPGLEKVHAYLTDQFGDDALEHVPSVAEHLTGLEPGPDQYLVVLWGDGGDEETEKLVDQASRLGVTVLDLTDGLEEFTLASEPPEPEPPAPARVSRRRADSAAAAAPRLEGQDQDGIAAETGPGSAEIKDVVAELLDRALRAALKELEEPAGDPVQQPPAEAEAEAKQESTRARANGTSSGPTRRWVINPETKEYLRLRGRPRNDRKDWEVAELTPAQEQELGLV